MKSHSGLTLIELMVVIVLAAILMSIAIPGYQSLIVRNHVAASSDKFTTSLRLARSEAAKLGEEVTVCPIDKPGSTVCGSDWKNGWMLIANNERLKVYDPLNGEVDLKTKALGEIKFSARGYPIATAQYTFESAQCKYSSVSKNITITRLGRIQISDGVCESSV